MALLLNQDLPTGVSGNYWKISLMQKDLLLGKVQLTVALFKDQATRETAGSKPLLVVRKQVALLPLAEGARDDRDAYYLELKKSVKNPQGQETNPFVHAADA